MADDIQSREVGEIIEGIGKESCAKSCEVHPYMKQGVIKSLRIGEQNTKLHKWSITIGIICLVSIWMKDASVGAALFKVLQLVAGG